MLAVTMGEGSKLNKGERIPRRPLPEFREIDGGVIKAISEDGLFGTALEDKNEYGPHAMIILLMIVATLTGGLLLLLRML